MESRTFVGGATRTQISNSISNTDTFIYIDSFSSYPVGVDKPFVVSLARGTANEEKVLVELRDHNILSAAQRGYDGTTAVAHDAGTTVDHVLDATFLQSVSDEVNDIIDLGASRVDSAEAIIASQIFS